MNRIILGDCRDTMRQLIADGVKVQMCVTSPPYWGLRDYGVDGQLGLEPTIDEFIANMVEVFGLVRELLADDGTLWLNMGDAYSSGGRGGNPGGDTSTLQGGKTSQEASMVKRYPRRAPQTGVINGVWQRSGTDGGARIVVPGLASKQLIGMPWRLAFALQSAGCADWKAVQTIERVRSSLIDAYDGEPLPDRVISVLERLNAEYAHAKGSSWWLRQDIIWHKPNPMPESTRDRCTKAHEYLFLMAKSERYYYDQDAIAEPGVKPSGANGDFGNKNAGARRRLELTGNMAPGVGWDATGMRNKRDVWIVPSNPYPEAHFATYPPALIEPCILAGSRPCDIVLDPFMGSGTTAAVALKLGRKYLGCELNPEYIKLAEQRTRITPGFDFTQSSVLSYGQSPVSREAGPESSPLPA